MILTLKSNLLQLGQVTDIFNISHRSHLSIPRVQFFLTSPPSPSPHKFLQNGNPSPLDMGGVFAAEAAVKLPEKWV